MKSQGDENTDDDCFDDPIRLNFEEKIQFLDPGIIDLDCDSDEDCSFVNEDPDDFNKPRTAATLDLPPVISPISNTVCIKPMSIKIVDCYKFPWFFDQSTKDIIEKKLFINKNVNNNIMSNEEINIDSEEFKNVSDTNFVNDGNNTGMFIFRAINNKNVNNNLSEQILDGSSNKHADETVDNNRGICFDKSVHNYTDMKSVHKMFGTKMRVINRKKQLENYNKRNDIEKQMAINQRNKTTVDIKKNTGLVGMKIQRITCEKHTMNIKETEKNINKTSKEKNLQKTLDKLYVKAVDKVLINIGTTITPVFDEIKRCANESGISQCEYQKIHEDSIVKPINKNWTKCDTLDIEKKNVKELKHVTTTTKRQNGNIKIDNKFAFINGSKIIAEKIMRLTTPTEKGVSQIQEKHVPEGDKIKYKINAKKTVNQNTKEHTRVNYSSLEKQKHLDGSNITKTIAHMPLSLKTCNKERFKSVRSSKEIETCEKKECTPPMLPDSYPRKKMTDIKKNKHDQINCSQETDIAKYIHSSQSSGSHAKNKWFPTLNRYTNNILNKIKAKQRKQYKINEPNKLHKQYAKKPSNFVQSKSEECKLMSSMVNVTKDLYLDDKICKNIGPYTNSLDQPVKNNSVTKINDVKNTLCRQFSKTQLEYSNNNQIEDLSNTNKCHPNNHNSKPNNPTHQTNTLNLTDTFAMHTIVSSQNESVPKKHIYTQKADLTDHNFLPNTPCSAIIKRTTQTLLLDEHHQAKVPNKPSTVYNSMQAHILYRPLYRNSQPPSQMFSNNSEFQEPMQHIGQPIYQQLGNHLRYPPSYTEEILSNNNMSINASLNSELNGGIPPQMIMNIRPSLEGNRGISPQMAFNTRPHIAANGLLVMVNGPLQPTIINEGSSGVNGGIPPQVESNARLSTRVKCGIPPLMTFNMPPPVVTSPQMAMNDTTAGVNGDIPPQMASNDRPISSSVSDSKIVWSYAFPPPNPPPSPPPLLPPSSQEIPGFPIPSQAVNSSIIGKNNDGIIKKINITAPVMDQNTDTNSKKNIIIENIHSASTPLYDGIATVDSYENSVPKIIKSEIIQESDDTHRMKSPVKYSTSMHPKPTAEILCNSAADSYACSIMPRSSLKSNAGQSNIAKKETAQPRITDELFKTTTHIATNDTYLTNSKSVLIDKCHESAVYNLNNPFHVYDGSKNSQKFTSGEKPSINHLTNSKEPQIKPNKSSTTSSNRIQPRSFAQLSENNPRFVGNTKSTTSKEVTHSKTAPIKYKKIIKPSTKKLLAHLFEDSTTLAIHPKKTDANPVNLKRTQPSIDDAKYAPPVKYKPGPLSKKMQFHNQKEKDSPVKTKKEQVLPSKGYSAPILPIPTYESFILDIPDLCNKLLDRPVKMSNKTSDEAYARTKKTCSMSLDDPPRNQSSKVNRTKRISLDEYKKKRLANDRSNQDAKAYFDTKRDISFKKNTVDMPRRASNVESDLGYDSDSTVIL